MVSSSSEAASALSRSGKARHCCATVVRNRHGCCQNMPLAARLLDDGGPAQHDKKLGLATLCISLTSAAINRQCMKGQLVGAAYWQESVALCQLWAAIPRAAAACGWRHLSC